MIRLNVPSWTKFAVTGIMLLTALFVAFLGFKNNLRAKQMKKACTASAEGTVTSVSTKRNSDGDESYSLNILFRANDGKLYEFKTRHTSNKRMNGDTVTVWYEPDGISMIYAETAPPPNGYFYFIAAGVLTIFAIVMFFWKFNIVTQR